MADGNAVLTMTNTQNSLSDSDLELLCEPLWRKDKARTGTAHSGLGLTVVDRFCTLLGIQLGIALPEPDRFKVTLTFTGQA